MFLGNLPVKYNSEGVGAAATTPTNANFVNRTFVPEEQGGGNPPPNPTPPSDDIVESDINYNLDVNPNPMQPYYVIIAALLVGYLIYSSLKKERSLERSSQ
jgi:hypothetical protein